MSTQPTPHLDDEQITALSDTLYDALYAITPYAEPHFADETEGLKNAVRAVLAEAAAPAPGVIEYGTAFRATEQAAIEVHSPTASRDEAAARADRYRDMYPVVHLVQRTVHYGEWTDCAGGPRG
ncbi:hypothetical protein [Streptomyces sp. rh34]|uniref:hypothetical protein n=1 Tax=Streptomyces sp. rh34 TaxID=2034272 RepID=UPI000BF18A59|nr:hypothetical protein [Streptomyces sp. rh34]